MDVFCHRLEYMKWIFLGSGFAQVKQVVRHNQFVDFRPHIYVLCDEFVKFESLWNTFGISDSCCLLEIIKSIACLHEGRELPADDVKRDLKIMVIILNEICKLKYNNLHDIRD